MQPSEKLFLQTVGRFVVERMKPLHARILDLENEVRELKSEMRELEKGGVRFCGVWQRAMDYKRGSMVTHDGATWTVVADEAKAMERPGTSQAWQLCEKSRRDAGANAA